jgi:hypothetical protein
MENIHSRFHPILVADLRNKSVVSTLMLRQTYAKVLDIVKPV